MSENLATALAAAQAEMPKVEPDAVNPHFKSKFVSLDHLIAKTRPVLNKHGLSLTQWVSHGYNGEGTAPTPMLRTVIMHTSGEKYESTMLLLVGKNDMQGLGGAITYARRYAWAAALGIASEEDDDGNQASAATPSGGASTGGGRGAAPAAPSPPAAANQKNGGHDALVARLEELGVEWKALKPEWNDGELTKWLDAKRRSEGELRAAIDTYENNIAAAKSPFKVPEDIKAGKAA